MSALKEIRRRLRSVESIKKITKAMERVAAARLRRAQRQAEQSRPYFSRMKKILESFDSSTITHPLFEKREAKTIGLVVVSADRGLSGSYNTNILSAADAFLREHSSKNVELILVGRKAIEHYKNKNWKIRFQFPNWTKEISFHEIHLFTTQLVDWFLSKELDEVWLVYTRYISIMERSVAVEKFLNIGQEKKEKKNPTVYTFEPNAQEVFALLIPRYCAVRIQTILHEARAAELAARVVAMQTASKNSQDLIDRLTLIRNKLRQREITRETIEIATGAQR